MRKIDLVGLAVTALLQRSTRTALTCLASLSERARS